MLTVEGRKEALARMIKCTEAAMAIFAYMLDNRVTLQKGKEQDVAAIGIDSDIIRRLLKESGLPPIADWRVSEVGRDLAKALAEFGPSEACAVSWFAHMLEHDVYDPNLKRMT
jgi:hypothetical protein